MKLTKDQKKDKSKELASTFKDTPHFFFTQYQGLKFKELEELREKLLPIQAKYRVLKNSMLSNALKEAGVEVKDPSLFKGPSAVLFTKEDDPVAPAKILFKFLKEHDALKVRAAYVGGEWLDENQCKQLSTMGTRPELLGQLAGTLYSAVAQGAWVMAAPIRDFVLVLKALEEKKKSAETAA